MVDIMFTLKTPVFCFTEKPLHHENEWSFTKITSYLCIFVAIFTHHEADKIVFDDHTFDAFVRIGIALYNYI